MENYQEYWENYEAETRSAMQRMSDEELIAAHNREAVTHGCGYARSIYVSALREEVLRRDWDAEILFKREADGKTLSYRLAIPVVILEINGRKTLIQNRHHQKNKP